MSEPAAPRTLVVEREMAHPQEKIWRALTQGALIEDWLMANDFQPVVGHRFTLRATPQPHWDGIVDCEVLAVEPIERLAYSWTAPGAAPDLKTVVTWTLTSSGGRTQVRMEQSGFGPGDDRNYQGAAYGWGRFIDNLESVVARLD